MPVVLLFHFQPFFPQKKNFNFCIQNRTEFGKEKEGGGGVVG